MIVRDQEKRSSSSSCDLEEKLLVCAGSDTVPTMTKNWSGSGAREHHQRWRRRRRGRRRAEEAAGCDCLELAIGVSESAPATRKQSDQTLALHFDLDRDCHYKAKDDDYDEQELSIFGRPRGQLMFGVARGEVRTKMTKGRPDERARRRSTGFWPTLIDSRALGPRAILVVLMVLMILTRQTLATTTTITPNSARASIAKSTTTTLAGGGTCAPMDSASLVGRTEEDKTLDDDDHPQSMLRQQQQREIPFKRPLKQRAPNQADEETTARSSATKATELEVGGRREWPSLGRQLAKRQLSPLGLYDYPTRLLQFAQQANSQQQQLQFLQQLRVSEADLLPFNEFTVQQPAFSDIMKSWPPTTTRFKSDNNNHNENLQSESSAHWQRHEGHQARRAGGGGGQQHQSFDPNDPAGQWQIRNHLNEDYDDTIVTADESFEQDQLPEPPTWVNYLGQLGDFIHLQLSQLLGQPTASPMDSSANRAQQQQMSPGNRQRLEVIEDLLDDFYYDQYENSQVLYYGPQLVHQGDIFEIGCYLPNEQPAEWTKSGRLLDGGGELATNSNPLRVIRRTDFMNAKQNYSLKVFEAQPSDSGNYRCNRLSRKYHKLVVVPQKISLNQQYLHQQRLLAVVVSARGRSGAGGQSYPAPSLSHQEVQLATLYQTSVLLKTANSLSSAGQQSQSNQQSSGRGRRIEASGSSGDSAAAELIRTASAQSMRQNGTSSPAAAAASRMSWPVNSSGKFVFGGPSPLVPSQLIHEHQPLSVHCHINDEQISRKLREMSTFQLSWYKNNRLLKGSGGSTTTTSSSGRSSQQTVAGRQQPSGPLRRAHADQQQQQQPRFSSQRVQFLGPNGRQMYISSANYADAGLYMCSWARLTEMLRQAELDPENASSSSDGGGDESQQQQQSGGSGEPQADYSSSSAGRRQPTQSPPQNPASGASLHQLVAPVKLRPFKSAYYVRAGNQLRLVCQVQRGYPAATISWYVGNQLLDGDYLKEHPNEFRVLHLQSSARSSALGNFQANNETQDETSTEQTNGADSESATQIVEINPIPAGRQQMQLTANGRGQWIEYRDLSNDKYSIETRDKQLRYLQMKLGQLTGANFDMAAEQPAAASHQLGGLLAQASLSVLVVNKLQHGRHSSRYACRATGRANTDEVTTVIRVKESTTTVVQPMAKAATLIPGEPLHFECARIGNTKAQFIWLKRGLNSEEQMLDPTQDDTIEIHNERLTLLRPTYQSAGDYICRALDNVTDFEIIKIRLPPYLDDFDIPKSHTGKSATLDDGESLELLCRVRDQSTPVNITWLVSKSPDNDYSMYTVPEYEPGQLSVDVMVERVDEFAKKLTIRHLGPEHRAYYTCIGDNGVTEKTRKTIYIRVKDKILPLWPFLGILAELFILFTIIYVWETQKAQKSLVTDPKSGIMGVSNQPLKRPASGPSNAFESVPLNC